MSTTSYSNLVPSKKSQRISYAETHCISDLPDWAICNILSRLPTRVAVRTSVLSKEWEFKWTSVYNIDINDSWPIKNSKRAFANFVERTLFFTHNVQCLRLSCSKKYDLHRMKMWISVALSRDFHLLKIYFVEAGFDLPRNLLNCSVRKLDLDIACTFRVHAEICFLYLKTLRLVRVDISNGCSTLDPVKFKFPVLETFELIRCKWLNVKFIEFYAPKMTSFESEPRYDDPGDYLIKIIGDSFMRFKSRGDLPGNFVLCGPTVVYAKLGSTRTDTKGNDLHLLEKGGLQIQKLLKGFPSLKALELYGNVPKAITLAKQGLSLPTYNDMERLVLDYYGDGESFLKLLNAAPCLKFLVIYLDGRSHYDYDLVYVPYCIASELLEVKFIAFRGEIHELKMAKFFIKNASGLKRVCITVYRPRIPKNEIEEELSTYPKASTSLNIIVI